MVSLIKLIVTRSLEQKEKTFNVLAWLCFSTFLQTQSLVLMEQKQKEHLDFYSLKLYRI